MNNKKIRKLKRELKEIKKITSKKKKISPENIKKNKQKNFQLLYGRKEKYE